MSVVFGAGSEQRSPGITVSLRLPAIAQLDDVFGRTAIRHQVIVRWLAIVVSTHATNLKEEVHSAQQKTIFTIFTIFGSVPGNSFNSNSIRVVFILVFTLCNHINSLMLCLLRKKHFLGETLSCVLPSSKKGVWN